MNILSAINSSSSDVDDYPSMYLMTPEEIARNKAAVNACMKATYFFEPGVLYCNKTKDRVCWPPTKAGEVAEVQCFEHKFTDTRFTTRRECYENGTWQLLPDYMSCIKNHTIDDGHVKDETHVVFLIGYSVTCLALIVAIAIFLHFKSLRCLRNLIHCNLMIAMVISNTMWLILTPSIHVFETSFIGCKIPVVIITYFNVSVYFWMFVEGIYLFSIIMWAYVAHKIRLWHFFIVGWGCPMALIIVWASLLAKYETVKDLCWLPFDNTYNIHSIIIYFCCTVLLANVVIVFIVIWILVRKLRMTLTIETNQIKKAVKALSVLLPLLGLHFIFTYAAEKAVGLFSAEVAHVFVISRNILQAFQGLLVALLYCFLNSEVQTVLRQRLNAVKENRSIQRYTSSILLTKSRASIPEVSSSSYNVVSKNRKPKMSLTSKCSADDPATTMSMMDSSV